MRVVVFTVLGLYQYFFEEFCSVEFEVKFIERHVEIVKCERIANF